MDIIITGELSLFSYFMFSKWQENVPRRHSSRERDAAANYSQRRRTCDVLPLDRCRAAYETTKANKVS